VDSQVKFFSRSSNCLNYKCSFIKTGLPGTSGLNGLMGQKGDTGPPGFVPPLDIYAPEKGSQGNVTSQKSNLKIAIMLNILGFPGAKGELGPRGEPGAPGFPGTKGQSGMFTARLS
jgi:collagen type IV alpha